MTSGCAVSWTNTFLKNFVSRELFGILCGLPTRLEMPEANVVGVNSSGIRLYLKLIVVVCVLSYIFKYVCNFDVVRGFGLIIRKVPNI